MKRLTMKRFRDTSADVTLYVGPEREAISAHSQVLALASDFFDAALGSGMLESQSKCIELPDQDPDAIRLLLDYMSPRSDVTISGRNVLSLIPLFHQYQCTPGLEAADEFCARDGCMHWNTSFAGIAGIVGNPVDVLKLSVDYGLEDTRDSAVRRLVRDITPDTGADSDVYEQLMRAWRRGPEEGTRWLHPKYVTCRHYFGKLKPLVCDARYAEVLPDLWPLIRSLAIPADEQAGSCQPSTPRPPSERLLPECYISSARPDRRRRV